MKRYEILRWWELYEIPREWFDGEKSRGGKSHDTVHLKVTYVVKRLTCMRCLSYWFLLKTWCRNSFLWSWSSLSTGFSPTYNVIIRIMKKSLVPEATILVPECHVEWDWDSMCDSKREFWLASLVPPSQLEWHSNDWSLLWLRFLSQF
jgi:hypothetical protein